MKNAAVVALLLVSVLASNGTHNMRNPDLTPEWGPLYWFFDRGLEPLEVWAAGAIAQIQGRDPQAARALKALEIAEERIAEIEVLAVANKSDHIEELSRNYEFWINDVQAIASAIADQTMRLGVQERIALATGIHRVVLEAISTKVPEQSKQWIQQAITKSENGQQKAIENLERELGAGFDAEYYRQYLNQTISEWQTRRR
ncbi:MAG: DUF5667 domain-containing protein, partial [Candidatus Bathyarchaeia archaeon]